MFFICGSRWRMQPLGQTPFRCERCARETMHTANLHTGKFTFFFLPCCTLRHRHTIVCNLCGLRTKMQDNPLHYHPSFPPPPPPPHPIRVATNENRFCPDCGEKRTVDSVFCTKCGTQFA